MNQPRISAPEAAARLGVKRETIYAYVSRGLLTSQRHLDGKSSTFDPAEIDRLRRRSSHSRPGRLEVPIASGITEVVDGRVSIRGHPLEELVGAGAGFEAVAELLWTGTLDLATDWGEPGTASPAATAAVTALPEQASPIDRMMAAVVASAAADPFRSDRTPAGIAGTARHMIRTVVDAAGPAAPDTTGRAAPGTVAARLWPRLTGAPPTLAPLLDHALVVLADHGMATSTLAARLAASTRAAPHAVILAGLGAVSGPLHGAASGVVHRLFEDAETRGADAAIATAIERDGRVPGLGHFIHRHHDPRHDLLMEALADESFGDADLPELRLDVVATVVARTADRIPVPPNVDLALGALTYVTGMTADAGEAIFAIARTAGWIAHAMEEYDEAPIRFRPVGRYEPGRSSRAMS